MVKTGKVTGVKNEGNQTMVNIQFIDNSKATVTVPQGDIDKYKDKYVLCVVDFHDDINIVEIMDHNPT